MSVSKSVKRRPQINVGINTSRLETGDELLITITPTIPVRSLYMRIIDATGVKVWRTTLIANGHIPFYRLVIGTGDLIGGKLYTIQVAPNVRFSPMGSVVFELNTPKGVTVMDLIPVIPALIRESYEQRNIEHPIHQPKSLWKRKTRDEIRRRLKKYRERVDPKEVEQRTLDWLERIEREERAIKDKYEEPGGIYEPPFYYRYIAINDARTCPMCRKVANKPYSPMDPKRPEIPRHPNCRCFYEIISPSEILIASVNELEIMAVIVATLRRSRQ